MKLSTTRYASMLCIQSVLLLVDIIINGLSEFLRHESIVLLVVFIIQDMCLIFSIILVFLSFFSTFVFQAGLVGILARRFGGAVLLCFIYLSLSITLHSWILTERWDEPQHFLWPQGMLPLYAAHRFCSAIYYHAYKRSMLRLADPRFYEDLDWIKLQVAPATTVTNDS